MKAKTFSSGVAQGQLNQKIPTQCIKEFFRYLDLIENAHSKLHSDVTNYVICTWFNHWTTVLIEEHIAMHPKIVPTIKNIKGIDIFFDGQPFDLKVTYLPRGYDPSQAFKNPRNLVQWMYENQGLQRFGSDNRLFVVLLDTNNPDRSWELKRDFEYVFQKIDDFFDVNKVTKNDEIEFNYGKKGYTTVAKLILITK